MDKKKILIVEDEATAIQFIQDMFTVSHTNYNIDFAYTGQTGLQQLSTFNPDLILLDIVLPDMIWTDVVEQFSQATSKPVIVVSGQVNKPTRNFCESKGFLFVSKPFKPFSLLQQISTLLP